MTKIQSMNNYETMLRICMIGTPLFTILAATCAFGWNYYGLKIKEFEKSQPKVETPTIQNVYNIKGDYVSGNKKVKSSDAKILTEIQISEKVDSEIIVDIGNFDNRINPYFRYSDNQLDFQFAINAVSGIGYILSTTFTMVKTQDKKPIDFKVFKMRELTGEDLIYKEKPLNFAQQAGNLTEPLLNSLYVVLDVKYTNKEKSTEKSLRKIYSMDSKFALKFVQEASASEYATINKYLAEEKNTLGQRF